MKSWRSFLKGIKGKLSWIALITVGVVSIEGWIAISAVQFQNASMKMMTHELADRLMILASIDSQGNELMRYAWASIYGNDQKLRADRIDKVRDSAKQLIERFEEMEKEHKESFSKLKNSKDAWIDVIHHMEKVFEIEKQGNLDQAGDYIIKNVSKRAIDASLVLEELQPIWEKEFYDTEVKVQNESNFRMTIMYLVIGIGLLLNFAAVFYIGYLLTKQLNAVSEQVSHAGQQVLLATTQLSASSQNLSTGSVQSASSLEETVSSLEELSNTVKMNSDNAREAATLSTTANTDAIEGEKEISELIKAMSEIARGSKKIEEIINVIDDIAFQTNLLALNAAVEAARAGEQGKGFAVVADAVRSLAQRSASAAKDISALIHETVGKTDHGSTIASKSSIALKNIVMSIGKVSGLNNEISQANQEQSRGIAQISKAMNELDTTSQKNAATAEEVAASSEQLADQSKHLKELVSNLEHIIMGEANKDDDAFSKNKNISSNQNVVHGNFKKINAMQIQTENKTGTTDGF